ncbi:ScbR family autoregulator-binding transcription factor [Streptomyces sp. NPDC052043]|uniref:ScbR family autoregulator-binding transcription factor n=1 Tax=Streptomyces sp. NPDC052043 TaxID=3365684 RepID=UPI0037D5BFCE
MVKQARAARTREALICAAAEVFADDGYTLASLPAISKRAGVSKGALHFHFTNKDALAAQVESEAAGRVADLVERARATAGATLQSLVDACSGLLVALADDPVVRAGFRLNADPSRKNGSELLLWWHERVRELVAEAQEAGEIERGVSAEAVSTLVVTATVGLGALGEADRGRLSPERVAVLWSFLAPRPATSPSRAPVPKAAYPEGCPVQ